MNILIQALAGAAVAAAAVTAAVTTSKPAEFQYRIEAVVTHDDSKVTRHGWALRGSVKIFDSKRDCEHALASQELKEAVDELKVVLILRESRDAAERIKVECVLDGDPAP